MAIIKCIQTLCAHSKLALKSYGLKSIVGRICLRPFGISFSGSYDKKSQQTDVNSDVVNKRLMEFFDDKKNWGEKEVKVGRAWCKEELRIKSNADLHKLWYILLKEKNMLLSMEQESNEKMRLFPNPERLDKVKESMTNLEEVVRERNKAYYTLETGEDGERPGRLVINPLGYRHFYKMKEHAIPHHRNLRWWKSLQVGHEDSPSVNSFLRLYREQLFLAKKRQRIRNFNHVQNLMRRFPHMDLEAVRNQYPEVNLEKARSQKRARGNHKFNL